MSGRGPTFGLPGGEHRVLEPAGAEPLVATRLDALAELWDGEVRLDLDTVVLSVDGHRRWSERLGTDPGRLTAAFAETIAERGGLGEEGRDATLIGRVAAIGTAHPHPVGEGERVAVTTAASAVPLFALPTAGWDGGRAIAVHGHAIVPASGVCVPVGDAPPELAAVLAATADLPAGLQVGERVVVIGVDRPAGAVALAVAAAQGRHVTAVVTSLATARLARALGADETVVTGLGEPVAGAERTLAAAGDRPDLVALAAPAGAALAPRLAPTVQVLTDPVLDPEVAAQVVAHARATGRDVTVHAGRGSPVDRGAALHELLAQRTVLLATLRWQAGLDVLPTIPPVDDDLETT